jgi:glycine hydroxymethyltransferase
MQPADVADHLEALIERNRVIHDVECINLNPATNVMSPRAERALSAGLGSRPSLGHAGEKYEMGLEAIEEIEVIAADLACQLFGATFAEHRVASGALANLYAFMATCQPGNTIVVPPATIGGHVTHRQAGAAGLYGLRSVEYPIDTDGFTVDLDGLARLIATERPSLVTLGGSLNLRPHPVAEAAALAHDAGIPLLFDAAHLCGLFAGGAWPNPLEEGADIMTMSTYKSLGGPAGGLLLTNRRDLAERLDAIAYPGLTANFDAGRVAALALTLVEWLDDGPRRAANMVATATTLAEQLARAGLPVHRAGDVITESHQFAIRGEEWGNGHAACVRLRRANLLACSIGVPGGDDWSAIRIGTPELVRIGMTTDDMAELAGLIVDSLRGEPATVAARVTGMRRRFPSVRDTTPATAR